MDLNQNNYKWMVISCSMILNFACNQPRIITVNIGLFNGEGWE